MLQIDAYGKACPTPVVLAKKALDSGTKDLVILVDNEMAVQNLTRLADNQGFTAHASPTDKGFSVHMTGDGAPPLEAEVLGGIPVGTEESCTFFISRDHIGGGDLELGKNLMKMFLYTLTQSDTPPHCLIFMNGGVRLPAGEEGQVIDSLRELAEKGCEILVCGTCLSFFDLAAQLKVGTVSNMYDIVERMNEARKVVSI